MIKILLTLAYLATFALSMHISKLSQKSQFQQIAGRSGNAFLNYILNLVVLLLLFVQFWILTGVFPGQLVLLLLAASTLGTVIYMVIGAIAGITLEEKKKKIGALSVIWGAQRKILGVIFLMSSILMLLAVVIGNLWTFWSNPYGDANALIWVAFFLFVLPQIVFIPILIVSSWPIMTSEYLDDDLRNSQLASGFSTIFYRTIYLLFPVWLFKNEIVEVFNLNLPSFWVLLSIPFLLFIVGHLLPFFVGLYRYRSQARLMMSWRQNWLQEMLELVKLPIGELRSEGIDEKLKQLQEEITRRFSQNKLFHYYQDVVSPNNGHKIMLSQPEGSATLLPAAFDDDEPLQGSWPLEAVETVEIGKSIKMAKNLLSHKTSTREVGDEVVDNIYHIIEKNRSNLIKWDIRFEHLDKLLKLYEIGQEGKTNDISGFVESRLGKISSLVDGLSSKRNLIAAALLSGITSALIWVFKSYQAEIFEFIGKLVQSQ